jgi:ubiquinone/menaquinone biosynthesis C-methylase UbiE
MAGTAKAVKTGMGMEGMTAAWYAKNTGRNLAEFRAEAKSLAARLKPGDLVLEIAPGPGYLAIELARLGQFRITGLDISRSFVRIAKENAARTNVEIDFRQGNASALPFAANWFDFIVCRAAFKNFADPVGALREMHRVLRPGATALIIDMRGDATNAAIADTVAGLHLGWFDALITTFVFRHTLRKRAYLRLDFERMAAGTPFGRADIAENGIGFEVRLTK